MSNEKGEPKKGRRIGGLVLVGCVFTGMGIGFALDNLVVGLFIGIGVGFVAMAIVWLKAGE